MLIHLWLDLYPDHPTFFVTILMTMIYLASDESDDDTVTGDTLSIMQESDCFVVSSNGNSLLSIMQIPCK